MKVHLKKLVMLILLCSALTTHATNNPLLGSFSEFHGGFAPKYRGYFTSSNFEEFRTRLAGESATEMFQYEGFLQDFLDHVRTVLGDETITPSYIIKNMKVGGAPKGLRAGDGSTYQMVYWDNQYKQIWGFSRDPHPGEDFIWVDGVCVASLFCFNFTKPVERKQPQLENEGIGYEKVDDNTSIIRTSYPGVTIINNNNNNNNNPGSGRGSAGPSINVRPRNRQAYYEDDGYDDSYYSRRRAPRVTWAEGVTAVSSAIRDVSWGISSLKNAFNPEPQTYNIRSYSYGNRGGYWRSNNYWNSGYQYQPNWQTQYNTGIPWHGGFTSGGNFQPGLYDTGGGIYSGNHQYSNDATVNFAGRGSGGYYGSYSGSY